MTTISISEFALSQTTLSQQSNARVIGLSDGRFFATWTNNTAPSGAISYDVMGQFFNADGSFSGSEFLINQTTNADQSNASATELLFGNIAVAFNDTSETGADTSATAVRVQIINATGAPVGGEFVANTTTTNIQHNPSIATLSNFNFAIAWDDYSATSSDPFAGVDVRNQRFQFGGAVAGSETLVNQTSTFDQRNSDISALNGSSYVIVWTGGDALPGQASTTNVYARLYPNTGGAPGPVFVVNDPGASFNDFNDSATLQNDNFVVIWTRSMPNPGGGSTKTLTGQLFDDMGNRVGAHFAVDTTPGADVGAARVVAIDADRFVVVWQEQTGTYENSNWNILAQVLNNDGTLSGPQILVNSSTAGDQTIADVDVLHDGRFIVSWQDATINDLDVRAQIYDPRTSGQTWFDNITDGQYYGTAFADTIYGNAGNDMLFGGGGADTIHGGAGADHMDGGNGFDFARYDEFNFGNLIIRLDNPALNTGAAAGDTYVSIEGIIGGLGNDVIVGDGVPNALRGGGGNDWIYGLAGNDVLEGNADNDHLFGGAGADYHFGGDGFDFARYDEWNWGNLTIRLDNPALNIGAAAAGDVYGSIEGLIGGVGNDTVVGNGLDNTLIGGGGNDLLYGLSGIDRLEGGIGNDHLWGGAAADVLIGGDGTDLARYDDWNWGNLTIRLDNAALNVGTAAAGDTYDGIEGLVGGVGNDVVVGNTGNNILQGGGGNDTLFGVAGNDTLTGGAGNDRFMFNTALNAASNVDAITDFAVTIDDILLAQSVFTGIGATLDANEFRLGTAALDGDDRIIYDSATGQVFFDGNGNGAGGQTLFATVTIGTALTIGDFIMV